MPKLNARSQSITSQESYSAVIIADLVAEVSVSASELEGFETQRRGSTLRNSKRTKTDETNLGYDGPAGGEANKPHNVGSPDTENRRPENGISKGVILNAMQFGQSSDTNWKAENLKGTDNEMNSKGQCTKVNEILDSSAKVNIETEPACEMSLIRKIIFGFSFLPSIIFVLCFAVILPCVKIPNPEPCVQEKWSITLNDTVITCPLKIPSDLLFTYTSKNLSGVSAIERNTGAQLWTDGTNSRASFIDCDSLDLNVDGVKDCLIMDDSGTLYIFNASDGKALWGNKIGTGPASPVVILPDCNSDGIGEIAVAASKNEIKVIYVGGQTISLNVSGCNTTPSNLMFLITNNVTDLIFFCEKEYGKGGLFKINESQWCVNETEQVPVMSSLFSWNATILRESLVLPTSEGLLMWVEDNVTMLQSDGSQLWTISSENHSSEMRFLEFGKFDNQVMQVALFSSKLETGLQVTTLNLSDGKIARSYNIPQVEVSDMVVLSGKNTDFVLAVMKKLKKDFNTESAARINEVTTTLMNLISNEKVIGIHNAPSFLQEIALMKLDGSKIWHTVHKEDWQHSIDQSSSRVTITASVNPQEEIKHLTAVITKVYDDNVEKSTQIKCISVTNWDISATESKCTWQ